MFEGFFSCLAIAASLCVNETTTIEVTRSTIWSGATFNLDQARVTSMVGSDMVVVPYSGAMLELCQARACVAYRGHCGVSADQFICTLWYSRARSRELQKIEVSGNRASVLSAMQRLTLVISRDATFPLSRFQYDAPNALPPTCYDRLNCSSE